MRTVPYKVLVVDDELKMRELLYDLLTREGYQVITAPRGEGVIDLLPKERIGLILLDIKMPGMDGVEVLKKIWEFDKNIKVVMLTDVGTEGLEKEARMEGVSAFLHKGIGVNIIAKVVSGMLDRSKVSLVAREKKMLIVDDEPEICSWLSSLLTERGFKVITAYSGEEALLKVTEEMPWLILLDIKMPGMDGVMTLKRIREIDENIGVIMITAIEDIELAKETKRLGAVDYITKPFTLEGLETSILAKIFLASSLKK